MFCKALCPLEHGLIFRSHNCTIFLQGSQARMELPPEETTDLEELEQFAKMFKQKRIKLGE